jgi:hypothetical protein
VRELARQYTRAALETLVLIMQNSKAPYGARVLAANAILDRGYGPPARKTPRSPCSARASTS